MLVISESDVLKNIFVKSFWKFHCRRESLGNDEKAKDCSLFNGVGLRHVAIPIRGIEDWY